MKAVPQRASLTLTPTQIPTALINLRRRKTRMRRKRKVTVRIITLISDDTVSMLPVFIVPDSLCCHSLNKEEEKPKENAEEEKKEEKKPKDDSPRPRPLHRTCSLFMRSIAPTISKAEIIAVSCTQVVVLITQSHLCLFK